MYNLTNDIMYNNIDTYVFLYCSAFEKNIKMLEEKFNKGKSLGVSDYFSNESSKILKIVKNKKKFIICKVSEKKCSKEDLDNSIFEIAGILKNEKKSINIQIICAPIKNFIDYQIERFIFYMYEFNKYKTLKEKKEKKIHFCIDKSVNDKAELGIITGNQINLSRNLINEPPNTMNSTNILSIIRKNLAKKVKLEIFEEKKLKKDGFNLILSVNNASKNKPYLLILKYLPLKKKKPCVLIGKGVTFDSGGTNIKYGSFHDMKTDMTGASVVFSTINLLAKHKVKKNVIALIPLVENMLNENATRPGDVIVSHSKRTVEILNTDAEGRLIMADCLSYSKTFNPRYIINISTLTGQVGQIFNNEAIAMMGTSKKLQDKIEEISEQTNEKIWRLPLWEKYDTLLKSSVADIKNSNDKAGSQTIIAGSFLKFFVPSGVKWVHLDIAGVSFDEKNPRYNGASGISIKTLTELVKSY